MAIALPAALLARVRMFIGDTSELHCVDRVSEATPLLASLLDACMLCVVPSERNLEQTTAFERLRRLHPQASLVAFFLEEVSSHRGIMALGRIGLADLVSVRGELEAAPLRQALAKAHALGVSAQIWESCRPQLPDHFVTLLKAALRIAEEPISVSRFADIAQMPERSLRQYCEDQSLPSPQWVIGWARLLLAGFYLDEPGRSISQVAELLQFPSSCALRNQLRRYAGVSPTRLRALGATRSICSALERSIAKHMSGSNEQLVPRSGLRLVR